MSFYEYISMCILFNYCLQKTVAISREDSKFFRHSPGNFIICYCQVELLSDFVRMADVQGLSDMEADLLCAPIDPDTKVLLKCY